jgi:hypothetical protein
VDLTCRSGPATVVWATPHFWPTCQQLPSRPHPASPPCGSRRSAPCFHPQLTLAPRFAARTVVNSADQHRAKPLPCPTEPPAHAPAHVPFLGGLHYSAPGPAPSTTVRAIGHHGWHTMNSPKQSRLDRAPPDQHALPCLTDAPTQPAPASTAPALNHWPHPVAMAVLSAPRAPGHPTTVPTTSSSAPIRGHDLVSVYPLTDCFHCR